MQKIIIVGADGEPREPNRETFQYEAVLEDRIASLPELIPLDSLIDENLQHVTIGTQWPAGPGVADIVLLSSDGVLTVVETKLARNPESRRKVIAQILEYAAYLSEASLSEIERQADAFFQSERCPPKLKGRTFNHALRDLATDPEIDEIAGLKSRIEQNLREGRIRLIVAVDEVGEQALKIITFLNSHSSFDIYLLQVSQFTDGNQRILVPTLHGYAAKVRPTERATWTWEMLEGEWPSADIVRARASCSALESAASEWQPESQLHPSWVTVRCLGRAVCGVQLFKRRPPEFWFLLDQCPPIDVPDSVTARQTKGYLYLAGDIESLSRQMLREFCRAALDQAGIHTSDDDEAL